MREQNERSNHLKSLVSLLNHFKSKSKSINMKQIKFKQDSVGDLTKTKQSMQQTIECLNAEKASLISTLKSEQDKINRLEVELSSVNLLSKKLYQSIDEIKTRIDFGLF